MREFRVGDIVRISSHMTEGFFYENNPKNTDGIITCLNYHGLHKVQWPNGRINNYKSEWLKLRKRG